MADTHPNAYLDEARSKREQANQLLSEAESLEAQAKALLGETEERPEEQPATEEPQDVPTGPEDATSDEPDENDPHRHEKRSRFSRNK